MNHIAYEVKDIENEIENKRKSGCLPTDPKSALPFKGKRIVSLLTPMRLILWLIED